MSEDGSIPRDQVIKVLKAVDSLKFSYKDGALTFYDKANCPEVTLLPKNVPRQMLHRLANKLGLEVAYFYHPEMASNAGKRPH